MKQKLLFVVTMLGASVAIPHQSVATPPSPQDNCGTCISYCFDYCLSNSMFYGAAASCFGGGCSCWCNLYPPPPPPPGCSIC
jgi:hypothetical protein